MWEGIRELGFFCILKHISRVCGPTNAMPTCMNFFLGLLISIALICDGMWRIFRELTHSIQQAGKTLLP